MYEAIGRPLELGGLMEHEGVHCIFEGGNEP